MSKHCHQRGQATSYGPSDVEETVQGVRVRVRMQRVPSSTCHACGQRQVSTPVAKYMSANLRRLLTRLPPTPADFEHPLVATDIVFAVK